MTKPMSSSIVHSQCSHEDILMKNILLTHALEDDRHIDPRPLIHLAEEIMHWVRTKNKTKLAANVEDVWPDNHNELGHTIHYISIEILRDDLKSRCLHARTMGILELLRSHPWGVKVAIVLGALAKCYGEFWLMLHFCAGNPLALSISRLKGLGKSLSIKESFGCGLNAVEYMFKKMVDVAKYIAEFENLPERYMALDLEGMGRVKAHILMTSYWAIRSSAACASQITSMIVSSPKQMYTLSVSAKWELWSSAVRINNVQHCLREKLDDFYATTEKNIESDLYHMFEEAHDNNQTVLTSLFAMKSDYPFRDGSSQRQVGVADLRSKVVLLFISRPVILLEQFLLILQQLQNHPQNNPENLYEIIWVPIGNSIPWSEVDMIAFNHRVKTWPWYSLYDPSMLNFSALKFIQEVWHFHDDPVMAVLDCRGRVISLNAIDMIAIWGELAYPFSSLRERELWEGQSRTIEILLDGIDPLLSYWTQEGRTICLYGSNDIEWIRELANKIKGIMEAGYSLELIYIGSSNLEQSKEILATVITERLSRYLSLTKICIFWLRLESIRNSKSRLGYSIDTDVIMREAITIHSLDLENKGWLLISEGLGNELLRLSGFEELECLSLFHIWGENINRLGFLDSIRQYLNPSLTTNHCSYYNVIPHVEGMDESIRVCKNCKGPLKKHYLYQCVRS